MKRIAAILIVVLLMLSVNPVYVQARENSTDTIWFEDGSYITVEINYVQSRASMQTSGTAQYTYYGDNGAACWKAVLRGNFLYTGTSATCTYSACDVTVYDSAWYTVFKNPAMKGNKATCDLTMGRKVLGVTVSKVPITLVLTCDANGNLS